MTPSQPYPGTPRWVKGFGILALLAAFAFVVLHAAIGGIDHLFDHGTIDHGMPGHGPAGTHLKQAEPSR